MERTHLTSWKFCGSSTVMAPPKRSARLKVVMIVRGSDKFSV